MRLIDADAFDRDLASREFACAMLEAHERDTAFEHIDTLYSTQSFRDVMKRRPTIEAVRKEKVDAMLSWLKEMVGIYSRLDDVHRASIAQQANNLAYNCALKKFEEILGEDN